MSGELVGIIVGIVGIIVLAIFVICLVCKCKYRFDAIKTQQRQSVARNGSDFQGVTAREAPPRYTPRGDPGAPDVSTGSLTILPPPYYSTSSVFHNSSALDESYDSPPAYESRIDMSSDCSAIVPPQNRALRPDTAGKQCTTGTTRNSEPLARRNVHNATIYSMDSFNEGPSMSEILLTSSRSSIPLSPSLISSGQCGSDHRARRSRLTDSARGDSLSTNASECDEIIAAPIRLHDSERRRRDRGVSNADVAGAVVSLVPEYGLRKKVISPSDKSRHHSNKRLDKSHRSTPTFFPQSIDEEDNSVDFVTVIHSSRDKAHTKDIPDSSRRSHSAEIYHPSSRSRSRESAERSRHKPDTSHRSDSGRSSYQQTSVSSADDDSTEYRHRDRERRSRSVEKDEEERGRESSSRRRHRSGGERVEGVSGRRKSRRGANSETARHSMPHLATLTEESRWGAAAVGDLDSSAV